MSLAIFLVLYFLICLSIAVLALNWVLEEYWSNNTTECAGIIKKHPRSVIALIAPISLLWPMVLTAGGIAGCRALKKLIDEHLV